jgi:hypothetical protein
MKAFFFGSTENDEEDSSPPSLPLLSQEGKDTVIPITTQRETYQDDSETSYSSEYSFGDDDDYEQGGGAKNTQYLKNPEYHAAGKDGRRWIDHIMKATKSIYEEPREMISKVFNTFKRECPYEQLNLGALEYIRDDGEFNHVEIQQGVFKDIFYSTLAQNNHSRKESCKVPFEGVPGVFLVNKHLDYVYGRVIESALLNTDTNLSKRAYDAFADRTASTSPCENDHIQTEKCCPSEWVLYVDVGSQFYSYCSNLLKKEIPCVNFGIDRQYVNAELLSFYLVLFLCGEHLQGMRLNHQMDKVELSDIMEKDRGVPVFETKHYTSINQWKKLPVWFVALWYAGHVDK